MLETVSQRKRAWGRDVTPWFRGEPDKTSMPLRPGLFRANHNENSLLQQFRMRAPSLGIHTTPPREHTDEWLFLAQHSGLPTRLLDWTEGLLHALHFAVYHPRQKRSGAAIWMLNPIELNRLSFEHLDLLRRRLTAPRPPRRVSRRSIEFDLPWFHRELDITYWMRLYMNYLSASGQMERDLSFLSHLTSRQFLPGLASLNIRAAWEPSFPGTELPVAVLPSYVHQRMATQLSRFTIHGRLKSAFERIDEERVLVKLALDKRRTGHLRKELALLGVTHSVVFPDLEGLARQLTEEDLL